MSNQRYDLGIVVLMSDIVQKDGTWVPDDLSSMRLDAAALFFHQECADKKNPFLVVAGGPVRGYDKPVLSRVGMYYLRELGVPWDNLGREFLSLDTIENAMYSRQILVENGVLDGYVVITNDYHAARSGYCFERKKMRVRVISAEDILGEHFPEEFPLIGFFKRKPEMMAKYKRDRLHNMILHLPFGEDLCRLYVHFEMRRNGQRKHDRAEELYSFLTMQDIQARIQDLKSE